MNTKNLYLISGKSGAGKSTAARKAAEALGLKTVDSFTTRPPRYVGEKDHIFISKEEFSKMEMIAYTMFNGYEYGVTKELLDQCQLYVIDPHGVDVLNEKYQSRPFKTIYLNVSPDILKQRMLARGDSEAATNARIENDAIMFPAEYMQSCDCIINADASIDDVTNQLIQYILNTEFGGHDEINS